MASTDATPNPIKNQALRITFPIFDNTGSLVTAAAGLDSEVSKDAGTFTDCTNEATEIATGSGMYYLDLTSTEMNADTVSIIVKTSTTNAKTTPIVIYPWSTGKIKVQLEPITHTSAVVPTVSTVTNAVLISAGTGAGQLDFTSGVVKANIVQLLATAFTESGAGRIVAGIKKFFDLVTPTSTMNQITVVDTTTQITNAPPGSMIKL